MLCSSVQLRCKHICSETGKFIFGFVLLIILIFLYTISSPLFLFRYLVSKAAKVVRPDLNTIVNPHGNLFSADLLSSKAPRCSLVIPFVIGAQLSASEIYQRFTNMVNARDKKTGRYLYPEYSQYVENWLGYSFWKNEANFDIKNHVKYYNPEGNAVTEMEFRDFVEELLNKKFRPQRSPWEVYVVNNYQDSELPNGFKTILIMRAHHTLVDGYSMLYSLFEGVLQLPLSSMRLPTPTYVKRDNWTRFLFVLAFPFRLMKDLGSYIIKGVRKSPFNVPDHKKSWNQIYRRAKPVPVQMIKEIKDGLGVTFTSVLLGSIAASMSSIAKTKINKKDQLNERAAFFIPLPMPRHPNALTNHVTGAQIDLPMGNFSDPTLRVKDCDQQLAEQKSSTIPWLLQFFGETLGLYFSSLCGIVSANRVNVAGLTNFPTGLEQFTFGSEDRKFLSFELAAGALVGISGVAFMAISYGPNIMFSVTAESAILNNEEVDKLLSLLREEIDKLHKIAIQRANLKSLNNHNEYVCYPKDARKGSKAT